jgi:hypothetical protein
VVRGHRTYNCLHRHPQVYEQPLEERKRTLKDDMMGMALRKRWREIIYETRTLIQLPGFLKVLKVGNHT